MKVEQIYTGCLAQGAYYIESNGEAAIIDPLREVQPYLDRAKQNGAKIKYVFETHFHADFVSGHLDLAEKTGAPIVFGPNANPSFDAHIAQDNETFQIGEVTLQVLHTPGHTMESVTYLLADKDGKPHAIFTGDTLFIGDVGRPDLAAKSDLTKEDLAGHLYDSLRNKIMPLPDDVLVYPAHGAGSACGKNMSKETYDTLGNQKKTNYALQETMSKEEFIKEVTEGLLPPPQYFPENVRMNKEGYESLDNVLKKGMQALSPDAFEAAANETGAVILDTRHQHEFVKGFIPNAIFIGIDGGFAPWVGALIPDLNQPILIVADPGREEEVVTRLSRVGYDNAIGYLEGGFISWRQAGKEIDSLESISAKSLTERVTDRTAILDVRKPSEYASEHVKDAINLPLDFINNEMSAIEEDKHYYVHCLSGYRSVIFSSILKSRGMHKLTNIEGGIKAIKETELPLSDYVCPSEIK